MIGGLNQKVFLVETSEFKYYIVPIVGIIIVTPIFRYLYKVSYGTQITGHTTGVGAELNVSQLLA